MKHIISNHPVTIRNILLACWSLEFPMFLNLFYFYNKCIYQYIIICSHTLWWFNANNNWVIKVSCKKPSFLILHYFNEMNLLISRHLDSCFWIFSIWTIGDGICWLALYRLNSEYLEYKNTMFKMKPHIVMIRFSWYIETYFHDHLHIPLFRVASSYVGGGSSGVGFNDKFVISGKFRGGAEAEFTPWIEVWEYIGGAVGIVQPWFTFVSICAWPARSE